MIASIKNNNSIAQSFSSGLSLGRLRIKDKFKGIGGGGPELEGKQNVWKF